MLKQILLSLISGFLLLCIKPIYSQNDLLIKNVTIIDVKRGETIRNQNVYINSGKITEISKSDQKQKNAKKIIDATDKFLIPGLWDMHTHNWWQIHFSDYYVANGVLGVRNMYTPMHLIKPLRDSINKGLINGPYYYAAGRVIEGAKPEFPDWLVVDSIHKIKPALDTLQANGSDFVKVYNKIPKEVYFELVKHAAQRGMRVEGHLPMAVSAIDASNAGQKSFEHLLGMPDLCTKDSLFKNKYNNNWFAAVMKEDDLAKMKIDAELAAQNFAILKKNNTYVCPTLVVWYSYFHSDTLFEKSTFINKKQWPADMLQYWNDDIKKNRKKDSIYKQTAVKKYETIKQVTFLLYKSGVPMIAGTDAMNPYCYPGFSLHREFELLKECGIPDSEILKMATINACEFLNLTNYGEVKTGNVASLVLLNENPLTNIKNTQSIETVILNGKLIEKSQLNKMME